MLDLRQTLEYAKYMESIGWIVERIDGVNYFIRKFPLIGSFIKIQRPGKVDFNQINKIAKRHKAFQVIIEPKDLTYNRQLITHNFRQSRTPFIPAKTIHIDLTKSEGKLLKEMHHKTRYNIKKAYNLHLATYHSKDIESFANFWQECARKQRNMFLSQKKEIIELYKSFANNAHLILVKLQNSPEKKELRHSRSKRNELLSGILMIRTKDIAYYMYAASSEKGKKLFAPTLNTWKAIKLAKKLKCKIFDFEGIYDDRFPLKSWKGFTRFKKSFGGREVEYPGAFSKFRLPLQSAKIIA